MKCRCWKNADEIAQDSLGMACAGQWSQVALSIFQHHCSPHGGELESWHPCQPRIQQLHLTDRTLPAALQQFRICFRIPGLISVPTTPWAVWLLGSAAAMLWLKYVSIELWAVPVCGWHRASHSNQFFGRVTDPSALPDHPRGPGHSSKLLQTLWLFPRLQPL